MNLIDSYIKEQLSVNHYKYGWNGPTSSKKSSSLPNVKNQHQTIKIQKIKEQKIYIILQKYISVQLSTKLQINQSKKQINLTVCLITNSIVRCPILSQKILLLRFFLNLNSRYRNLVYKVDPISGWFAFTMKYLFQNFSDIEENQLEELLIEELEKIKNILIKQMNNISFYLDNIVRMQQQQTQTLQKKFLKETKRYITHSKHYAWKILKSKTQNSKKQLKKKYQNLKEQFMNSQIEQIKHPLTQIISSVNNLNRQQFDAFKHITFSQDQTLKNSYLPKPCVRKQFKLLNDISISKQALQLLKQNPNTKVYTPQFGNLNFQIFYENSTAIFYEKQILSKLPPEEFIGLAKYFYVKNLGNQTQNLIFTNLNKSLQYSKFLENNYNVISITTKLYMINQISLTLKYLRDNNIIFHNLQPNQILIKKGFKLKIHGFKNSYHESVLLSQYQPCQNIFPYVAIYKMGKNKTYDDQRSDVYSLGVLIYYTIFGKCHWNIKDSSRIYMNVNQQYQKYQQLSLFSLDRLSNPVNTIIKLIINLSFNAIKHQVIRQNYKEKEIQKKIIITDRPYLDWMVIIIRHIMTYYQLIL